MRSPLQEPRFDQGVEQILTLLGAETPQALRLVERERQTRAFRILAAKAIEPFVTPLLGIIVLGDQ